MSTVAPSEFLEFQTAKGTVVTDTDAHLWVHLMKDSPSVLSLGRLCDDLGTLDRSETNGVAE